MFTPKKIAAISGIVGSLAAICAGAGHAYADGRAGDCGSSDNVCIRKSETHVDKDGERIVRQEQHCTTPGRPNVVFREHQLLGDGGSATAGPVVDCSNTVKLPKGFKKPKLDI
ncbi:hypothetical protein BGM19_38650 [Streptomyces agglomeratus]|uniref:Uncharacterized protein n=1 Tax=Streptomyces agglomeratus TaxID=285458 RepID=A0A1E5NYL3_9ACTN|nr:hypothetical protein [Streptomyces agglomeratus]OEJ21406.1 hypothetical protein AS594_38190 [Streptomyces agglomeratus]OEJ36407.1 hypothetical protein BGK72_37410 [Streptomyces agglomeratus]OEJ56572.1 hypothetical protein BGM19_38650 [Streptomyces agglomeratus]